MCGEEGVYTALRWKRGSRRVRGCQCEAEVSVLLGVGHETHIGMSVCSQSLRDERPRKLGGGDPALVSLLVGD